MVVIHIANIDGSVIGGVQIAVPKMVKSQSEYASVGLINTHGNTIDGIQMLDVNGLFDMKQLPAPFDRPDIIVFHEVYRFEYIKLYKAVQKAKIPYIIVPHGCLSKQAQKRKFLKKFAANIVFFCRFIRSAHSIQYLSDNEAKMSAFPKTSFFVCGNGIEIPHTKKTSFFNDGIRIVYIGRLEIETKGLDLLLEAIKQCAPLMRQTRARVEIYGPDYNGERELLCKMADKFCVCDLVSVGSEKIGAEKECILLASDCFIQSSRTEGLPMGPLEALGYGLPCIVTDGVGLGELIEQFGAGYRCETSVSGIARALRRFISEREKTEEMSTSAIRLIKKNFDSGRIAGEAVDRYSRIATDK